MSPPAAYFLTWTCYGTWLHGDARGSVDRHTNTRGTPFIPPDPDRERRDRRRMRGPSVILSPAMRTLVARAIENECAFRGWAIVAMNVRTCHVHVVVRAMDAPPEAVMQRLKARATNWLRRDGHVGRGQTVWTRHGSTRYCNRSEEVWRAKRYVEECQ